MRIMIGSVIALIIGFVLLLMGANYFVDGAAAVAQKFHIRYQFTGSLRSLYGIHLSARYILICISEKFSKYKNSQSKEE